MNNNIRFAIYDNRCEVIIYTDKNGRDYMTAGVYRMYVDEPVKRKLSFINNNSNIDIIAIGNGTASRESETFIANVIKDAKRSVSYIIVNLR